jgi:hypothetical protein
MSNQAKLDPFKPSQPRIPGVATEEPKVQTEDLTVPIASVPPEPPPVTGAGQRMLWTVVAAIVGLATVAGLFYMSRTPAPKDAKPAADVEPIDSPRPAPPIPKPLEKGLLTGPGTVASTAELSKPWSAKRFLFRSPLQTEPIPAMVVHLPGGQYWGFSLIEPYGTCELDYISDLAALRSDYQFHASHPMVVDPCSHTVFDLSQYGTGANGSLVRGEIVQGSGLRPPFAIEIHVQGKDVRAVRME